MGGFVRCILAHRSKPSPECLQATCMLNDEDVKVKEEDSHYFQVQAQPADRKAGSSTSAHPAWKHTASHCHDDYALSTSRIYTLKRTTMVMTTTTERYTINVGDSVLLLLVPHAVPLRFMEISKFLTDHPFSWCSFLTSPDLTVEPHNIEFGV